MMIRQIYILIVLLITSLLSACGKSAPPDETPDPNARAIVVCIGGAWEDCTGTIYQAVKERCPDVDVVQVGDYDAYKVDVGEWLNAHPHSPNVILVGHSRGGDAIAKAAVKTKISYAFFIDPVAVEGATLKVPASLQGTIYYRSQAFGFVTAKIEGGRTTTKVVSGDHGSITQSLTVIDEIVDKVNSFERVTP
jgi:hypothetical protein